MFLGQRPIAKDDFSQRHIGHIGCLLNHFANTDVAQAYRVVHPSRLRHKELIFRIVATTWAGIALEQGHFGAMFGRAVVATHAKLTRL